jgi:hypothetical protein
MKLFDAAQVSSSKRWHHPRLSMRGLFMLFLEFAHEIVIGWRPQLFGRPRKAVSTKGKLQESNMPQLTPLNYANYMG